MQQQLDDSGGGFLQSANGDPVTLYEPKHPYARPGGECTDQDLKRRVGPCTPQEMARYAQCNLPLMFARIMFKGTVAAAGDPIIWTANPAGPKLAFVNGTNADSASAGFPTTIQGGKLSQADTSVAKNDQNSASVAPDNELVFTWFAMEMGMQQLITVVSGRKSFGNPTLKNYAKTINDMFHDELVVTSTYGSQTGNQLHGTPSIWRKSNYQDVGQEAGQPVYMRCHVMSGAPNDSDKLSMQVTLPFDTQTENDGGSPTLAETEVYAQLSLWLYGGLGCRTKEGICTTPAMAAAQANKSEIAQMRELMAQQTAQINRLTAALSTR